MRRLGVGPEKKLAAARIVMDRFIAKTIAEKKQAYAKRESDDEESDLLSAYIEEKELDSSSASDDERFLRDTAMNFMLAGRDTTGSGLSWFFWLLSKNPRVEEKLLQELNTLSPPKKVNSPSSTPKSSVSWSTSAPPYANRSASSRRSP
uniref:Uncharacterized protein n=1 Tax=Ananas comosus var. bracteatus TaxID=296719 RepID=A0A6V7PZA9_ANACO|nr:unnamed protein product [Ananas comosus var. bracteatus]